MSGVTGKYARKEGRRKREAVKHPDREGERWAAETHKQTVNQEVTCTRRW